MKVKLIFVVKHSNGKEITKYIPLDKNDYWNVLDNKIQEMYYPGKELWLDLYDVKHGEIVDEIFIQKISK